MTTKKKIDNKGQTSGRGSRSRHDLFVAAYLSNGKNASKAALEAGYSKNNPGQIGSRLLKDPRIAKAILDSENKLLEKHNMTAESVLKQLGCIVHFDIRKLYNSDGALKNIHELDDETASALSSFEIDEIGVGETIIGHTRKVKVFDKNAAIDKAMRHFGLLKDGASLTVNGNVIISKDDADLC